MQKQVTVTWQKDADHESDYEEELIISTDLENLRGSFDQALNEGKLSALDIENRKHSSELNLTRLCGYPKLCSILLLKNALDELLIMKCVLDESDEESWYNLNEYHTMEERYIQEGEVGQEEIILNDFQKMMRDLCFVIAVVQNAKDELEEDGAFSIIENAVLVYFQQRNDEIDLCDDLLVNNGCMTHLESTLSQEYVDFTEELKQTSNLILVIKDESEDVLLYSRQKFCYLNNWESARSYQKHKLLEIAEKVYTDTIANSATKIEWENRTHSEIDNFLEESQQDYLDEIQFWMQAYDTEIERRDSEMLTLKMEHEQLIEDHKNLKELFARHQEEIDEWLAIKEVRRIAAELAKMATRIQAWWRGVMVRRKLGRFGKKKKKGKKGKKDKKKGKKGKK